MDEGKNNNNNPNIKSIPLDKNSIHIHERDLSPFNNLENRNQNQNQREINAKMNKFLSIMYDDNFVLMINEISSSIKKYYKEMNQNFLELKKIIQNNTNNNIDNTNLFIIENNNSININDIINIFNNIQKSFGDFYSKAKIVFKKMKNYRNEKLKHINESANELQNNKLLKIYFSKNNEIENDINIKKEKENDLNIKKKNGEVNDYNIIDNNMLKSSLANCVMNKIFITDIKLLLNILKLEKISNEKNGNNKNNILTDDKNDLFNKKEDLINKINKEFDEIMDKNIFNNINPYITNNNIILSNNNINNNNFIQQNDNFKYEIEKKELFDIIEKLNIENNKIKEENVNFSKMNENITSKLNKITLKQEISSNL